MLNIPFNVTNYALELRELVISRNAGRLFGEYPSIKTTFILFKQPKANKREISESKHFSCNNTHEILRNWEKETLIFANRGYSDFESIISLFSTGFSLRYLVEPDLSCNFCTLTHY